MNRRAFLRTAAAAGAALMVDRGLRAASSASAPARGRPFHLKYAPHFGQFVHHAGNDLIDQIKFMADEGFAALEDNGMMGRDKATQEKIAAEMARRGMTMGEFVGVGDFGQPTFVRPARQVAEGLVARMRAAVEVAKRVNARWCIVVPGALDPKLEPDYQTANCIENLKRCAAVCEPSGLVMVVEPLNPWRNHPGLFLQKIPQAFQICQAVGSPSCKILDDLYHQQITEGNLIPNIDMAWEQIAYFHIGDTPGRLEPMTGEVNYHNVFAHIYRKGYKGVLGMEHGQSRPGKEGERAVIDAYRLCDDF